MRRLTVILLLTYFAILTGASFWGLRIATLHYGKARLEQGFNTGFTVAQEECKRHQTGAFPPERASLEGLTLAKSAHPLHK